VRGGGPPVWTWRPALGPAAARSAGAAAGHALPPGNPSAARGGTRHHERHTRHRESNEPLRGEERSRWVSRERRSTRWKAWRGWS
jgi:hypothetical protein